MSSRLRSPLLLDEGRLAAGCRAIGGIARMPGARGSAHRSQVRLLCAALAALAAGCLPIELGPIVQGRVLDAQSGAPVADAVVVVRFDLRRDERLPERDLLGHREARTDAEGRFRLAAEAGAGLSAWSQGGAEARVVGVIKEGYRCPHPRAVSASGRVTLQLELANDRDERRASCRPVGAGPGEAPSYQAAWQELYRRGRARPNEVHDAELERLLSARATFGFGENCRGPAVDLALSPDGERVAVALDTAEGQHVEVLRLVPEPGRLALLRLPERDRRRLGWVSDDELVLWEPGAVLAPTAAPSGSSFEHSQRTLWRSPSASAGTRRSARREPGDLADVDIARWQGRSFQVLRSLDATTGFGIDRLRIDAAGRDPVDHRLPGEACGPRGQYGRPHFRIDASGGRGLDLRFVEGGCHAVSVDFGSGAWRRLDSVPRPASECREQRRVPLAHLRSAVGDYVSVLEQTLLAADGDPEDAYSIEIGADGHTRLSGRDYMGGYLRLEVPDFPLRTPLHRIVVTTVAGAASIPAAPATDLLEPL